MTIIALHARAALCIALIAVPTLALGEETICIPEYYYNSSEQPPIIIPIDAARAAGSRVTRIDIESGAYREHFGGRESDILTTGSMSIINPGSMRERIDFVALDPATAEIIRISLMDDGLPFVRFEANGNVSSGHCTYEYDQ